MGTVQIDGSTPKITVGNATAEDATILFDGNAQDFYIALDDSADDLLIGLGSTVGTTPAISIDENLAVKTYGDITMTGATPTLTIGDAGAEDTKIVFDGNAQDFYIALDDSADDLLIGLGSTVGTTPIISIDENKLSTFSGAVTVGVDDTGHDVKFFGATASSYMLWDESADDLNLIASGLGVGTAKDLGTGIHVRTSDSSGTARNLADELVLENSGGSGMTILSGTSNGGFINFGDSGDEDIGSIYYDHNANSMHLYTNNNIFLQADSTGAVTKPLQPSFAAYGGEQNGLGQTTWITGVFGTEAFDVNTDYNHSTSTFTAPVTGKYIFTVSWGVGRFSGRPYSYFNTSNRNYPQSYYGNSLSGGYDSFTGSTVADMDANDTCMWQIYAYDDSDWDLSCNYFTGALLG